MRMIPMILSLSLAGVSAGCAQTPKFKGAWSGRIQSVPVYDDHDNIYAATVLEIIAGPRPPYEFDDFPGTGRFPLLVTFSEGSYRIIDPKEFPTGSLATARGLMMTASITTDRERVPHGDRPVSRSLRASETVAEHIIVLRERPRLVDSIKVQLAPGFYRSWKK